MTLAGYSTLIFDCDGVILDSNRVKTAAFFSAASPYGELVAAKLVEHHVAHGGVSRYAKFAYFLDHIIPSSAPDQTPVNKDLAMAKLLADYAEAVKYGLMNCAVTDGLPVLRNITSKARWCIVSGGDEAELQSVFSRRGLTPYFDAGIFGSPTDKTAILEREFELGNIRNPALYLGDSRLDHQVASAFGIDFVFVSQWTEFSGWQDYCAEYGIPVIDKPAAISSLSDITPDRFT